MGGVTSVTLIGDADAVTVIDVETIAFADGGSYSAADAWAVDNTGISYDLANKFPDADATFTYSSTSGTITAGTLAVAATELAYANSIVVTATANDSGGTETTATITVSALKTLKIAGVQQHDEQTIDLDAIFVDANTYTYSSTETLPSGISRSDSILTFNNTTIGDGSYLITITATDGDGAPFTHTLTYDLDTIKDQSAGSNTSYSGTTLADIITGNSFSVASGNLAEVNLYGSAGNDTISNNTFTGDTQIVRNITIDGGAGDDTISDNRLATTGTNSAYDVYDVTFMGDAGDDVFSHNTATQANDQLSSITIDGGDGTDKVYFELADTMFNIDNSDTSNIIVTDKAKRTNAGDNNDVNSHAQYVLIDVEELYFNDVLYGG